MSFQRIVLTAQGLRNYERAHPPLNPHPLQKIIDQVLPAAHVSPEFALTVAMDLLGMEHAFGFVRANPLVLTTWVHLLETHGWGNNLREQDIQVNLLMNAIKTVVNCQGLPPLKAEQEVFAMIQNLSQGDIQLENALITSLILHKGLELPWALVATLPANAVSGSDYGVFKGSHLPA